jgi:hypothetical protein
MTEMMWSLLPWLTFMTATPLVNLWAGLAAGLVVAIAVLVRAVAHKKVRMLEVAGIASFVGLAAAVVAVNPADIGTWGNYAQAGAHGLLTVLVLGSVLIGRPFTAPYARAQAPESVWHNPRFVVFNREISLVWGFALLVGTASLVLAGSLTVAPFILRMAVPTGAMLFATWHTRQRSTQARSLLPSTV